VGSKPEEDVQLGVVSWGIGCALTDFPGSLKSVHVMCTFHVR